MKPFTAVLLLSLALVASARAGEGIAMFAGGCFWCMEAAYQGREGVTDVVSGFTGGSVPNPTYQGNHAGHFEAIRVTYDPAVVSYQQLLDLYWVNVDPFDNAGQFCDKGPSYRSAIFPATEQEMALAQRSLAVVAERFAPKTVHTEIRQAGQFWPVEEYHQDYFLKNPVRYKYYRWNCGRDQRLKQIWGGDFDAH
ncbi:MAG: peptide-methionine (S)-S-oxide reductase MsrA [Halieaceae bacterium]|jgi:peptide-methionine (S)-S-oxide reductase|nr:peptide-methionine (S)-S-oxide reductase MsrA [Halieaceae bacterium]